MSGKAPELFNPVTGAIKKLARYQTVEKGTRISIDIKDKSDSFFVVFRDAPTQPSVLEVIGASGAVAPSELDLFYDSEDQLIAESTQAGSYILRLSDSTERTVVIDQGSRDFNIEGLWATIPQGEGGYSVRMETSFELHTNPDPNRRVLLDLGQVEVMAKVTLNGKTFDTLWMPPFALDVTDTLKSGANTLQILVTSTSEGKPKIGTTTLRSITRKGVN